MGILRTAKDTVRNLLPQKVVRERADQETVFSSIYQQNEWGDVESVSGPGSTLAYTENLRKELPQLIERFSVNKMVDAPCGDFNWMQHVVSQTQVEYVGLDIVEALIESNRQKFGSIERVRFQQANISADALPKADMMMCRDCLFHLSWMDTRGVLENFLESGTPYLFTSHHILPKSHRNKDIVSGGFRRIDLMKPPYNFPNDSLAAVKDWIPPFRERDMILWHRDQVDAAMDSQSGLRSL